MRRLVVLVLVVAVVAALGLVSWGGSADEVSGLPDQVDFNFHIRPILSNNCFLCHGPDPSSREADLRLDLEETATAKRTDGMQAIAPGRPNRSEIIRRITSEDPDYQMPPPHTNKTLSAREKALLKKWIRQGAEWKEYWAFIPPVDQAADASTDRHPIDQFIDESLSQHGLQPAGQAEPQNLLRRLSFVLTGLPPDPAKLGAVASNDPSQYERWVDEYLASPHFGERWARHWMDLARYADGRGHEFDYPVIGSWQYRDYLIRAFNHDVPYDLFVKEQLAGDCLPPEQLRSIDGQNDSHQATAFLTLAEGKHSPVDVKEEELIRIDNMIDVTSKTFQALTVACSRCHDHKFDPIPTKDYYAMYGMFESTRFHLVPSRPLASHQPTLDSVETLKREIRTLLANEVSLRGNSNDPSKPMTTNAAPFEFIGDFRGPTLDGWFSDGLAFGDRSTLGEPDLALSGAVKGLKPGRASSRALGTGIQGALRSPTFTIDREKLLVRAAGHKSMVRIIMDNFQLIQNPIYGGIQQDVDRRNMQDYVFDLSMWHGTKAYIELLVGEYVVKDGKGQFYAIDPEAWIEAEYAFAYDSIAPEVPDVLVDQSQPINDALVQSWAEDGQLSTGQVVALSRAIQRLPASNNLKRTLAAKARAVNELGRSMYDSLTLAGVTAGDDIESPVFIRGSHKDLSEEKVPHAFLSSLGTDEASFDQKNARLAFAEAIASPDNPLTARVMVNRIWHHLFGRGIVETVDNFGLQGSLPSHPALLDHLAVKFARDGWSVKKMIKYMVMSEAFQRSTAIDTSNTAIDPENRFLHAYPVRRLEAEAIRDAVLACAGSLDLTMYGPSIPIHLDEFLRGRGRPPASGPLDGAGRRSIYQALLRNFLPPMMLSFDMPIPFSTFGNRNATNVPAQSLNLLNDPFIQQQAALWAEALPIEPENVAEAVKLIYQTAFSRTPTAKEIEDAQEFMRQQAELYGIDAAEALSSSEVWTDYCHSIFNLKEFIYLL